MCVCVKASACVCIKMFVDTGMCMSEGTSICIDITQLEIKIDVIE